jgi:hypothetical protein
MLCSSEDVLLQPAAIRCTAGQTWGRTCGAEAAVRQVHYRYVTETDWTAGELRQVLSETHYDIECPHCGRRTQVEPS